MYLMNFGSFQVLRNLKSYHMRLVFFFHVWKILSANSVEGFTHYGKSGRIGVSFSCIIVAEVGYYIFSSSLMIFGGRCLSLIILPLVSSSLDKQFKRAIRAKYFRLCGLNMVSELGGKTYPVYCIKLILLNARSICKSVLWIQNSECIFSISAYRHRGVLKL